MNDFRRRLRDTTSVAAATIALVAIASLAYRHWSAPQSPANALAASAPPLREFDGRIVDFPYRPFDPARTVASVGSQFPRGPQRASLAIRMRAGSALPTDPHQAGLYHLVAGKSSRAVESLERALTEATSIRDARRAIEASKDYALLTHLSIAYVERGTSQGHASDFIRALKCADRAWRLRETPETIWNRAVSLQRLHLNDDARVSWRRYLQRDSSSPWVTEARKRLESTDLSPETRLWLRDGGQLLELEDGRLATLSAAFPLEVRRAAEKELLPAWANAVVSCNDARAAELLRKLDVIGATRAQRSGDAFLSDVVLNIRALPAQQARMDLARAILTVTDAKKAYDGGNGQKCRAGLRAAIPVLARSRSPLVHYARFYTASSYYHDNDYSSLRREADGLNDIPKTYRALRAQTSWILGLGEMAVGKPDQALHHYQDALAEFAAIGESDYVAAVHNLLAEAYEYLDSPDEAWNQRERALALVSRLGPSSTQWVQLLNGSAELLLAAQEPAVAKIFVDRALRQLGAAEDSLPLSNTVSWQAVALHRLGHHAEAAVAWKRAASIAERIAAPAVRERAQNNVLLKRALTLERDVTPAEMEKAVAFAQRAGNRWALPRLLRLQGDVLAKQGAYLDAMRTYSAAIDEILDQRRKTTLMRYELANRASLADVTDRALTLAIQRGDYDSALRFSEHSAGSALGNLPPSRGTAVPPNVAVIKVICLTDRVVTWTMTARGVHVREASITIDEVRRAVEELSGGTRAAAASRLGKAIISPELPGSGIDTLVFIPDASVATVRVASLTDPATGKHLVERYVVAECPTIAAYLRALERPPRMDGAAPLLIDGAAPGSLARLSAAEWEIRELRRSYPAAAVWKAGSGEPAALSAALENAGMIHFAAHAVVDRTNERLSNIVLGRSDALLYAHEIVALRLSRRPIVVLSTCSGAETTGARRRRPSTLADAFLAAGASAVVASSEPLEDTRAQRVALMLHDRLRRGVTVGAAVRDIQLTFAREGHAWDDLVVVGNPDSTITPPSKEGMNSDA